MHTSVEIFQLIASESNRSMNNGKYAQRVNFELSVAFGRYL